MNFSRDIDEMVMSSTSTSEEEDMRHVEHAVRRPYRTYCRAQVDDFDDVDFRKYFRLNKDAFWRLYAMVHDGIDGDHRRYIHMFNSILLFRHFSFCLYSCSSRELTAEHKLLGVLRMLACGNFEQTAADYIGISQPTVANILPSVRLGKFLFFSALYSFALLIYRSTRCATQFYVTSMPSFECREPSMSV